MFVFAQAFFIVGGLIVLLMSIVFAHRYPSPFFRAYTVAFGCTSAVVALETVTREFLATPPGGAIGAAFLVVGAGWFVRAIEHLTGRAQRRWLVPVGLGLIGLAGALAFARVPASWIVMVGGLPITAAMCWLGAAFWRLRVAGTSAGYRWLGASLVGLGLWPVVFPYPLVHGTPLHWVGYAGSGVLQVVVGVGMLMHLLDETWHRFREEQARLGRLKSDFVSVVSHELRTPLTTIVGFTEFLEDGIAGPVDNGQREYLHHIQTNTRRLQGLVNDLLDFSALDGQGLQLERRAVELGELVRETADEFGPRAQAAGITLTVASPPEPVRLPVDPERIGQVVANLVDNALKFTPRGGRVHVSTCVLPSEARIEVTDTGPGIPADQLPHVFDKFFQGDGTLTRTREGAGLGLAISRSIAEAHGGTLTVESRPGAGSTFRLSLPLGPAPES